MEIFTKKEILPIALIILAFGIGGILYNELPESVPSHWNAQGEIDAYSSKSFAVLFFPIITLGVYLLMLLLPLIDPLKKNYAKFALTYFWFRVLLVVFFILLYFYTLAAALGTELNINYFILPLISVLFIVIGIFLPKIKKNYFVGIRTPWTIHSEEVWDKTHQFSGKLFVGAGVVALFGLLFSKYSFAITIVAILATVLSSIVYSYFEWRKNKKQVS